MTACVNRKHTRRVALAISASLVGALSLGAVPALAQESGIETLATEDAAVKQAKVEYRGGSLTEEFTYTGRPQGPVPTKVTPVNEDTERVAGLLPAKNADRETGDFYYYYVALDAAAGEYAGDILGSSAAGVEYVVNDKGDKGPLTGYQVRESIDGVNTPVVPSKAGKYAIVIGQWNGSGLRYVATADTFSIVGQPLDTAVLCDDGDATDTEFAYTGENGSTDVAAILDRIDVALDGTLLDKGTDYKLELWDKGGKKQLTSGEIKIGATYIVKVIGNNSAYDGQVAEKEFTLGKLDLSASTILGETVTGSANRPSKDTTMQDAVASINGVSNINWGGMDALVDGARGRLALEFVSNPDDSQTSGENTKGYYTFKLVAADDNPNVTGEATFTVAYADYEATVDFGNAKIDDGAGKEFTVDRYADDPEFDVDDITASFRFNSGATVDIPEDGYTVTVLDAEGNEVEGMALPGTYYVRVDVDYDHKLNDGSYAWVAGSDICKVVVTYVLHQDTDVFLSYDGQNIYEQVPAHKDYTGEDHVSHFTTKVIANGNEFTEGEDYTVSYRKIQDDGKVVDVDEIVDAGSYLVVVEGITFSGNYDFSFIVDPIEINSARVVTSIVDTSFTRYLAWTGEVLTPEFEWDADGKGNFETIPADLYDVEYVLDVDGDKIDEAVEVKDAGEYTAYLTTKDGVVNYYIDAEATFEVTDAGVFADVPSDYWAAENIYAALKNEYMSGYSGTDFFGPLDNIKRGDVAVVLYNMAGEPEFKPAGSYDEHKGYETGFDDVEGKMYYAKAIAWAKAVGIVSGDEGTNFFRPEDSISRQELAKMLCVYAEKTDHDVDVDADAVLADYEDANTVSDWAKDYVAWAVEADLMGQDSPLRGTDPINRAEVATMAVRLQPKKFDDSVDLIPR